MVALARELELLYLPDKPRASLSICPAIAYLPLPSPSPSPSPGVPITTTIVFHLVKLLEIDGNIQDARSIPRRVPLNLSKSGRARNNHIRYYLVPIQIHPILSKRNPVYASTACTDQS